jgi:hypothetical protein
MVESIQLLDDSVAQITLQCDRLALFVVLTTQAQGRFSENAFVLRPMQRKVRLISSQTFFDLPCSFLCFVLTCVGYFNRLIVAVVCPNDEAKQSGYGNITSNASRRTFGLLSESFPITGTKRTGLPTVNLIS